MEILVQRTPKAKSTIGDMYINGTWVCSTLEDVERPKGIKIAGETAIPRGKYKVTWTYSQRFGRCMPEILGVPMFTGVRIHSGNTTDDTSGCILVGTRKNDNLLEKSRAAASIVDSYIEKACKRGEDIWITIEE